MSEKSQAYIHIRREYLQKQIDMHSASIQNLGKELKALQDECTHPDAIRRDAQRLDCPTCKGVVFKREMVT